jgi:hypothetical protein
VLLPGRGGTSGVSPGQLAISSLAVGLGPRSPATATASLMSRSTSQHDSRRPVWRTSSDGGAAGGTAGKGGVTRNEALPTGVGPLHSNLGYGAGGGSNSRSGPTAAAAAAAVSASLSSSSQVHMGLLLSPATRLSLGGASTGDEAGCSSGRPSLGPSLGGERRASLGDGGRASLSEAMGHGHTSWPLSRSVSGAAAGSVGAAAAAAGEASVGDGAGCLGGAAGFAGAAKPGVMASWSSWSSTASAGARVPRLSFAPILHVPDAPVPGSGVRSGASSSRLQEVSAGAVDGEFSHALSAQQQQQQQQQQAPSGSPAAGVAAGGRQRGSSASPSLPPPPPELLAHLRLSQQQLQPQQEQQQQQDPAQKTADPTGSLSAQQCSRRGSSGSEAAAGDSELGPPSGQQEASQEQQHGAAGSSVSSSSGAAGCPRGGIGSCRISTAGAAADRDKLVSKVRAMVEVRFSSS